MKIPTQPDVLADCDACGFRTHQLIRFGGNAPIHLCAICARTASGDAAMQPELYTPNEAQILHMIAFVGNTILKALTRKD